MKTLARRGFLMILGLGISVGLSRAEWQVETVDSATDAGFAASFVLNPATDVPFIAYYRQDAGFPGFFDLQYATQPAGGAWDDELIVGSLSASNVGRATSIALTELGTPVASYTASSTQLRYASRSGGMWSISAAVSGTTTSFSSLAWRGTEGTPRPLIAFYDSVGGDLELASFTGVWASSTLDSSDNSGDSCSIAQLGDYMGIAYINGSRLGYQESINGGMTWADNPNNGFAPFNGIFATSCALAIAPAENSASSNSRAHIFYFDPTTNSYRYVTNDTPTGVWANPEVVFVSSANDTNYYGRSIAVGSDGVVRVAFLDFTTRQLKYVAKTSTGWPAPETVDSGLGGAFCTLQLTATNQPRIAYAALTSGMSPSTAGMRFAAFRTTPAPTPTPTPTPTPSPSPTPSPAPVASDLQVLGKKKRTTGAKAIKIQGTASSNIVKVEWRIGKKKFKSIRVSGGSWVVRVRPLAEGRNKVQFRGVNSAGEITPTKSINIRRK